MENLLIYTLPDVTIAFTLNDPEWSFDNIYYPLYKIEHGFW